MFDGIWNSATATPLERPAALKDKAFFTPEEAAEWERQVAERNQEPAPEAAAEVPGTGTYNTFYPRVRHAHRQDPADLHRHRPARRPHSRADARGGRVEAPPHRGIREAGAARRIPAFRISAWRFSTAGPPMLPYSYNSNYQIMQTKDAVVVHAEMIHDARIIHARRPPHLPPAIRRWMGDSIGHWDGDDARRRHDELQRRRRILRRCRRQLRLGPESPPGRAVQPARRRHAALPIRDRRPDRLHEAVERRIDHGRVRPDRSTNTPATKATTRCRTCSADIAPANARRPSPALADARANVFAFCLLDYVESARSLPGSQRRIDVCFVQVPGRGGTRRIRVKRRRRGVPGRFVDGGSRCEGDRRLRGELGEG